MTSPSREPGRARNGRRGGDPPACTDAPAPLRLFFALWPDAGTAAALAALSVDVACRMSGRAPPAANLHLTLAFVGEVLPARLDALRAVGRDAATRAPAFSLTFDRVGAFRGSGIVWAGTGSPPPEIDALAAGLGDGLAGRGFPVDARPFHPHVTLARRCRRPGPFAIGTPIRWSATRLALNASALSPRAPAYRVVDDWPLGG